MNIPNRDYWLAPERRDATLEYLHRRMMVLGIAHQLLAIYTIQLAIIANLKQAELHESIYWALGLYFLFLTTKSAEQLRLSNPNEYARQLNTITDLHNILGSFIGELKI